MKSMMGEGEITTCHATVCSYNQSEECHAQHIQVGGHHATCDTFDPKGGGQKAQSAGDVGGCDMTACHFNSDSDCQASGITVAYHENHADCMTFRQQM